MNKRLIIAVAVIAVFLILAGGAFKKSLTPYVTFAEARSSGRTVQVSGKLVPGSVDHTASETGFSFVMADSAGEEMRVFYEGVKPANLEDAESIVAVGRYEDGIFNAKKLLVKCPSKYQAGSPGAAKHPDNIPRQ